MRRIFSLLLALCLLLCACQADSGGAEEVSFAVHFIDVGQADSALVVCDGETMLIDGGNAEDSNLIYTYLKKNGVAHLDYIIATHEHEDHVGGIPGALKYASVGTVYSPVLEAESGVFGKFQRAVTERGASLEVPSCGDSFSLGSAEVHVLGPVHTDYEDVNNTSIVLKVTYGETSFLFTGDMERESEQDVIAAGYDLSADVLKVGHHGSRDSSTYPFLSAVMPQYAVISVGKDNSYGHPTEEALSRLRDAGAEIYRTDILGDIICISDGRNISFITGEEESDEFSQLLNVLFEKDYILNTSSKKFHLDTCSSAKEMNSNNKEQFYGTRWELIDMGYSPCGSCNP